MTSTGSVTLSASLSGMATGETGIGPLVDALLGPVCYENEFSAVTTAGQAITVPANAQGRMLIIVGLPNNVNLTLKGSNTGDTGVPLGNGAPFAYLPVVPGNTYNLVPAANMSALVVVKIV